MSADNERRPGLQTEAASMSLAGDTLSVSIVSDSAVRCRRCRQTLTANRSVRLGVGPRCRHLEHGETA